MEEDLPYKVEYSKSSRASCRLCREKIEAGVLRLAIMVQVKWTASLALLCMRLSALHTLYAIIPAKYRCSCFLSKFQYDSYTCLPALRITFLSCLEFGLSSLSSHFHALFSSRDTVRSTQILQ
jgi:hypothetical protein